VTTDPVQLVIYIVGGGIVILWLLLKTQKRPLQKKIGAWAISRGFKFYPRADVELNRKLGLPNSFRYENIVITDMPGGCVGCIYRRMEDDPNAPKIRMQEQDQDALPGDLAARITFVKPPSGKGVFVPKGQPIPKAAAMMAPSATGLLPSPANRYDFYTDGVMLPADLPPQFFDALDKYPIRDKAPTLLIDGNGLWLEDPVYRGHDEHGYDSVRDFCYKVSGTLAKWTFPKKGLY